MPGAEQLRCCWHMCWFDRFRPARSSPCRCHKVASRIEAARDTASEFSRYVRSVQAASLKRARSLIFYSYLDAVFLPKANHPFLTARCSSLPTLCTLVAEAQTCTESAWQIVNKTSSDAPAPEIHLTSRTIEGYTHNRVSVFCGARLHSNHPLRAVRAKDADARVRRHARRRQGGGDPLDLLCRLGIRHPLVRRLVALAAGPLAQAPVVGVLPHAATAHARTCSSSKLG